MPKRPSGNSPKKNDDELVEMAAEQLANLFWKHWVFKKSIGKPKPRTSGPKHFGKKSGSQRSLN